MGQGFARSALWMAALVGAAFAAPAHAQTYPNRPITFIVPYAAGGTTDVLARIIGKAMGSDLGQTIVIENAGGAGGTVGTQRVVRADPDGYTLTFGNMGSLAANVSLYPKLSFDPRKDLAPVGVVANVPMVLSVSKKSGVKDVAGFIEKLKGGEVNFGHSGPGSTGHLAAVAFLAATNTKATNIAYRGAGPAITDLAAGVVDAVADQTVTMIPMHTGGNVTAIGVTSPKRLPQIPDVPTFAESGLPGVDITVWNAIAALLGNPPAVLAWHEKILVVSFVNPVVKDQ